MMTSSVVEKIKQGQTYLGIEVGFGISISPPKEEPSTALGVDGSSFGGSVT